MRLVKARVQNYRSIMDSGDIEIEKLKTILVGPNEAGKTVLLRAIQQLNKPDDIAGFDYLRDYPRSLLNDIQTGKIHQKDITVVTGYFELEEEDKKLIPVEYHNCQYKLYKNLDNKGYHSLVGGPEKIYFKDVKNDLLRLVGHMDKEFGEEAKKPSSTYKDLVKDWSDYKIMSGEGVKSLKEFLENNYHYIEEGNEKEENRYNSIIDKLQLNSKRDEVLKILDERTPVFILFNNYFKVKPIIHLEHLAQRVEQNILDDEYYDYGNICLLKLLDLFYLKNLYFR